MGGHIDLQRTVAIGAFLASWTFLFVLTVAL